MKKSIFVESVRLLIVLALVSAGYAIGLHYEAASYGALLGAACGYVAGGVLGRFLRSTTDHIETRTARLSAGELVAGMLGSLLGGALGALLAAPALAVVPGGWGWPGFCLAVWIGLYGGFRILRGKSSELLRLARLSDRPGLPGHCEDRDAVLVDTSVLLDPRLLRLSGTGFLSRRLMVPAFVLDELRGLSSSEETAVRGKARRGLEALEAIGRDAMREVRVVEDPVRDIEDVDAKLVALASRLQVPLLTNDEALGRVAELRGVRCLSLHRLARSLSSVLAPGELLDLEIVKPGQELGEGVGFLDEGWMVVVRDAADRVGQVVAARVRSSARTPRGRIVFAELVEASDGGAGLA